MHSSYVQTRLTRIATAVLSSKIHSRVEVGGVDFSFTGGLILENVYVEDMHQDTLMFLRRLSAVPGSLGFSRDSIVFFSMRFEDGFVSLKKYKGEETTNLQFLLDAFSKPQNDTSGVKKRMNIICNSLVITGTRFSWMDKNQQDHSVEKIPNGAMINFSDIQISGLTAEINNIIFIDDSLSAIVKELSFSEKSGFSLKRFNTRVHIKPGNFYFNHIIAESGGTSIASDIHFRFDSIGDFNDFNNKIQLRSSFENSTIALSDLAHFTSGFDSNAVTLNLSGTLTGYIGNLKGQNLKIFYGKRTLLSGDMTLTGLPKMDNSYIQFRISKFFTTIDDLRNFRLKSAEKEKPFDLPVFMNHLTEIAFKGEFTGFYNDFVAYGNFFTPLGKVACDLLMKNEGNGDFFSFKGNVKARDFALGRLLNRENILGKITFDARVDGSGSDLAGLEVELSGQVQHIAFNSYTYQNARVEGNLSRKHFTGFFAIDDENLNGDFNGNLDFSTSPPQLGFRTTIRHANLARMNILTTDSSLAFSSSMDINMDGFDPDDINGTAQVRNIKFSKNNRDYPLGNIIITASKMPNLRTLTLSSSIADAELYGAFRFEDLPRAVMSIVQKALPSVNRSVRQYATGRNTGSRPTSRNLRDPGLRRQDIHYAVHLKNTDNLTGVFFPGMQLKPDASFSGFLNDSAGEFLLTGKIPSIDINGIHQTNLNFNLNASGRSIDLNATCKKIALTDSIFASNINLTVSGADDTVRFETYWGENPVLVADKSSPAVKSVISTSGLLKGTAIFNTASGIVLALEPSEIILADSAWAINANNSITFDTNRVSVQNLSLSCANQYFKMDGNIGQSNEQGLNILLSGFTISTFQPLLSKSDIPVDGIIFGNLLVSHLLNHPSITANIVIENFSYRKDTLGNLSLSVSTVKPGLPVAIHADLYRGKLKTLEASGEYDPGSSKNNFDLNIKVDKLKLYPLEQYIGDIFSSIEGVAMGDLKLSGSLSKPVLTGSLKAQRARFNIDYLKARYSFADEVIFSENCIAFDSITVFDMKGNKAIVNGKILHNYFSDFRYDFTIDAKDFQCLNTSFADNDLYYGQAYGSGKCRIKGDMDNVFMDISAKTEKGTQVFIPLSGTTEVSEGGFIIFRKNNPHHTAMAEASDTSQRQKFNVNLSGIQLNFNMEATPDAEVQLIFDERIGDIIKGRGNGNLKMYINSNGDFNMYGDFIIEKGDYLFTLKNVINKRFEIEKGGTIKWDGNPYDADINLNGIYSLRASLKDLNPGDTTGNAGRVPVDCRLLLSDKLLNPDIRFEIGLPGADESRKDQLKSIAGNEQEMNKQIFSLLVLGRFQPLYNTGTEAGIEGAGSGAGANSTEFLSNQLSNWLSRISDDFDIGVKYRPGDNISGSDLELALSTQLFNDRLEINGNVGKTGNQSASGIVGDVTIEYLLTKDGKLRVKAFNDSNDYTTLTAQAPFKQGIGLSYRKEFNSFRELFKRKKKDAETK